jgi:hypothetical protein
MAVIIWELLIRASEANFFPSQKHHFWDGNYLVEFKIENGCHLLATEFYLICFVITSRNIGGYVGEVTARI